MACETATKTGMVMIFGEITTSAKVDYEKVVRDTCREVGFTSEDVGLDADNCKVLRPAPSTYLTYHGPLLLQQGMFPYFWVYARKSQWI